MTKRYTQSFKLQAVEKALNRPKGTSLEEILENLRVGRSTLGICLLQSEKNELELSSLQTMSKEKRPQNFSLEERLDLIITCSSLDDAIKNV